MKQGEVGVFAYLMFVPGCCVLLCDPAAAAAAAASAADSLPKL
jgi:hypothetical protein